MLISIVIRTLNEETHLNALLQKIYQQDIGEDTFEVVLVDSGSSDKTLDIARSFDCRITSIPKASFSFGRSLNLGCELSRGQLLVFISGHCIPVRNDWLASLVAPIKEGLVAYSYGMQEGGSTTKFSEHQVFSKFYPSGDVVPQEGFFCNNANAALLKESWEQFGFDEKITGLEDMFLAKQLENSGLKTGYVASASVYHIHDESWEQVEMRYEREAIALQEIMPEVQVTKIDAFRYFSSAVFLDAFRAYRNKVFWSNLVSIVIFRFLQYRGTYKGNHDHRILSVKSKEKYFYPRLNRQSLNGGEKKYEGRSSITNESP